MSHTTSSTLDYAAVVADARRDGGITVSLAGHRPSTGYIVSLPGREWRIPLADFDAATLRQYVSDHAVELSKLGHYLGVWVDAGSVYLDVSRRFTDHTVAIVAAEEANQRALYNLNTASVEAVRHAA